MSAFGSIVGGVCIGLGLHNLSKTIFYIGYSKNALKIAKVQASTICYPTEGVKYNKLVLESFNELMYIYPKKRNNIFYDIFNN